MKKLFTCFFLIFVWKQFKRHLLNFNTYWKCSLEDFNVNQLQISNRKN